MRPASTTLKIAHINSYVKALDLNDGGHAGSFKSVRNQHAFTRPYVVPSPQTKTLSKPLYFALATQRPDIDYLAEARSYLDDKLSLVDPMSSDFPQTIEGMTSWLELNNHRTRVLYQRYLTARQQGAPRRFFATKSHALNFLQGVAPTKLVDGSWLYGLVNLWEDSRYANLINIYLEELGDGHSRQNHVLLYKKLLAENDCQQWIDLPDEYFTQGTIQLALGLNAEQYTPEVIGFNLGYEQLPLHLLISAYELKELGIDPYYFTLHVTIDNASTGHARKSLQALFDIMPSGMGKQEFLRRVGNGYKLNQIGLSTNSIIAKFDLEEALINILKAKSHYGKQAHNDRCRIGGKTINDWLSNPEDVGEFLKCLVDTGWIKRYEAPENSRFWKLIEGDDAKMFGIFSQYEKQVLRDWISGDAQAKVAAINKPAAASIYQSMLDSSMEKLNGYRHIDTTYDPDVIELEQQLASMESFKDIMQLLGKYLSPMQHHTPAGLLATRLYRSLIYKTVMAKTHSKLAHAPIPLTA